MSEQSENSNSLVPSEIAALRDRYVRRRESSLLEAITAATSLNTIVSADAIDYGAITPQMRKAFELSFPNDVLEDRLADLDVGDTAQLAGFMSNWRGKYFEVLVVDELNSGGQVGNLVLSEGRRAVLAVDISQPGWDLQIIDETGAALTEIQLKATGSVSYLKEALEKYPDIDIVATDEAAEAILDESVAASGFDNAALSDDLHEPLDDVIDSPLVDALEAFGAGLPIILITGTEGAAWLVGRQDFASAMERSVSRAVKSGAAIAVGGLLTAAGAGAFAVPATLLARLGMARHGISERLNEQVGRDTDTVRALVS